MMNGALTDGVKKTLLVVGALFPIVNPIGNTPIFLALTRISGSGDHMSMPVIQGNHHWSPGVWFAPTGPPNESGARLATRQ
jgi:hypothetical protein